MTRSALTALLLLACTAPEARVQEAPAATRVYVAYYQIKYGDLEEWMSSYYANSVPVLESLVEEGAIVGFGARMHSTGGEYNIRQVLRGNDDTDFEAFWDQYLARLASRNPADFERGNRMILAHHDEVWNIDELNVPADGGQAKYMYDAQFQVNFADMEEWTRTWHETFGPALEQAMADGILQAWVTESHNTGGKFNWKIISLVEEWDDIDDLTGRIFGAAPLSHPVWDMFTAHKDEVWETLPPPAGN